MFAAWLRLPQALAAGLAATALAAWWAPSAASAGEPPAAPAAAAAAAGPAATPAEAASAPAALRRVRAPDTTPYLTVVEDDGVRIEETRVRGTVTRVVVQSKLADVPPYEIQVSPPGRAAIDDRGVNGRRTWSLLRF